MDQLSKLIATRRAERARINARVDEAKARAAEATRDLDVAQAELREVEIEVRALEQAAALRPVNGAPAPDGSEGLVISGEAKRGGRQPGSISHKWRAALADLVSAGNNPVDEETFYLVTRGRLGLNQASVRERVRNYVTQGFLVENDKGKISVSEVAIKRFDLQNTLAFKQTAPPQDGEAANGSGHGADNGNP